MSWEVERLTGPAAVHHARDLPDRARRAAWLIETDRPALVLGSTQSHDVVDRAVAARAGVDLVRRRSGGGAVLLEPGQFCWVDLVVPRDDPLWDDDVGAAAGWVGDAWVGALAEFGLAGAVHRGPMAHNRWSALVCFAGLGSGEVTLAGRKGVGLSQRRTRVAARFQCLVLRRWEPAALLRLLRLDPAARAEAEAELVGAATGVDHAPASVADALLRHLP